MCSRTFGEPALAASCCSSSCQTRARSGTKSVRLESLKFLSAAHALYKSVGFAEITPYAENSMTEYQPRDTMDRYRSSAVFMELRL